MTWWRPTTLMALIPLVAPRVAAQQPDSAQRLPDIGVTVARTPFRLVAPGLSLSRLDADSARRGRTSPSLDALLAFVPGVVARERPDRSLDTRIAIRGAGARANFGVRGVRVMIDGVPATLPDGQTPLTALDLELVDNIEVARGPLAALHGNGSLGVVGLTTPARFGTGLHIKTAAEFAATSVKASQAFVAVGGGGADLGGLVAISRVTDDGTRHHSRAEQWRARAGVEWQAGPTTTLVFRAAAANDPRLDAPGALTLTEFAADPTAASPTSVARNAGKSLTEQRVSLALAQRFGQLSLGATAWTLWRTLENPLAAPAPAPASATEGVWVGLDRRVSGARSTLSLPLGHGAIASAGLDVQTMRDLRTNRRHDAGVVSGPAFLDQVETITELGGFAQVSTSLSRHWSIRLGGRHDRIHYDVADHIDAAAGGVRTMAAWSAAGALAWSSNGTDAWISVGNAFETPTSTELANTPDGSTGLNRELDPTRTTSGEIGLRTRFRQASIEVVGFTAASRDAITAVAELGGRSYFANVGRTTTRGVEATVAVRPVRALALRGTVTALDATFGANNPENAGHGIPGITPFTARAGVSIVMRGTMLDIDQSWSTAVWADDANTIRVPGWGPGVTNAMLRTSPLGEHLALTLSVRNLFDRAHAVGVVVNGGFGRVVEPGSGRRIWVGVSADR